MKLKNKLRCQVRNKTETSADLVFYGDIVADEWSKWSKEDKSPEEVLAALQECKDVSQLNIYMNSGGGNVFAGNAIYNRIMAHSAHKTVYIDGIAASIASVIALAGDEIVMPSNTYLMIHKASCMAWGNSNELRETADWLEEIEGSIVDTYMKNVADGVTQEDIVLKMADETWLKASEAAELFPKVRVVDEISISNHISDISALNFAKAPEIKNAEPAPVVDTFGMEMNLLENFIFEEENHE